MERADAARNRRKILAAAAELLATRGVESVTMEEVATAAGVGVGTVYRRFPDRGALAQALLDAQEREFQAAFLQGPPPLGPGAPPAARLQAFLHAFVDRLATQAEVLVVAETSTPTARLTSGAYALHRTHLATLIRELRQDADEWFLADALLAPLAAAQFQHQHAVGGMSVARIKAGLGALVTALAPRS